MENPMSDILSQMELVNGCKVIDKSYIESERKKRLNYYDTSGRLAFVRVFFFFLNLKTPKRHFEVN